MPYSEPSITDENGEETYMPGAEYLQSPYQVNPYVNTENVFIKHLTEVSFPEEVTEETKQKWVHRRMFSGKEKSTAFISNPRTCEVNEIQRMNMNLMETLQLENLIWGSVFDNIDIMKMTQGQHGNLLNAITVKRQEFTDKTINTNKTIREKLSGMMQRQPQQQEQIEGY